MPLVAIAGGILAAGRLPVDRHSGMSALLWATPSLTPFRYALGIWAGAAAAFSFFPASLGVAGFAVRWFYFPGWVSAADFSKAAVITGLLPLLFAVTLGLSLGALLGTRLAGVSLTLYFLGSSVSTSAHPQTGEVPFYRFMVDRAA